MALRLELPFGGARGHSLNRKCQNFKMCYAMLLVLAIAKAQEMNLSEKEKTA